GRGILNSQFEIRNSSFVCDCSPHPPFGHLLPREKAADNVLRENNRVLRFRSMASVRFAKLFVLTLALVACRRADHLTDDKGAPIILISIDTLRSDHLPAYGYTKVQTPAIDQFRADSILYERAYSHAPLTLVSHASMFTG